MNEKVKKIVDEWLKTGKYVFLGIVWSDYCDLCEKDKFGEAVESEDEPYVDLFLCDKCSASLRKRLTGD